MTKATSQSVAAQSEGPGPVAAKARKERSTNYPAHTIHEAVARAEPIWKKEKRAPISSQIAAERMGFKNATSGAAAPLMSSLRKYGIIEQAAHGEIRISDDANIVYLYPPNTPEHTAAMKRLATRPPIFNEVLKAYPELPSDETLRAKLMHRFGFVSAEAANTFIRTLRAAVAVGAVDGATSRGEDGGRTAPSGEAAMTQTETITTAVPRAPAAQYATRVGGRETHAWKLDNGVWAEITITGPLSVKGLAKLKGYVALLDAEEDEDEKTDDNAG